MIDHPANSRAVKWFTMGTPFCYLSAAMGLESAPAQLKAGEHWTLRYGLAIISGPADTARLSKLAGEWTNTNQISDEKSNPAKP